MQRKLVTRRLVAHVRLGSMFLVRIGRADGRRTWGVSTPGGLSLFGTDRAAANAFVRAYLADPKLCA